MRRFSRNFSNKVSQNFGHSFGRYLLVGAVSTAVHWLVLAALVEAGGLPPWLSSGAGALVGAQLAFEGNRRFTFAHQGPRGPAWWRFMGTAAAGALLGMGVVGAGVALGLHYLAAQAVATTLVALFTYAVNRRWSFAG